MTGARTIVEKIWAAHAMVHRNGLDLLHIDRHLLTDLSGTIGLEEMEADGRAVRHASLTAAIPDHVIATSEDDAAAGARRERFVGALERLSARAGVRHMPRASGMQGIVHVVALERGMTLPGATLVCGDSHTSTHGAVGALAWGIGSTEVKHVLATQALWMKRPKLARVRLDGALRDNVYAKDVALWLIGRLGADWGREHAIEFAGDAVASMSIEARATLCNMAVELGARIGIVAPDAKTLDYIKASPEAPRGVAWNAAAEIWSALATESGAVFDKEVVFDVGVVRPQITWGTSLDHVMDVDGVLPQADAIDASAAAYTGLAAGAEIVGAQVDYVFIGSCANGRIEDLRAAAAIVQGRRVAPHVTAWIVPGSQAVKAQAEAEGLDRLFSAAGFDWRQPGCSMCVGVNGDLVPPGKRCVSTSNRNFVGRQGPGARTHLASPATAAACAVAGVVVGAGAEVAP